MHDPHSDRMSGSETRAASGLALVFAFRMLGMFMVLPVLATYGMDLAGATPALIGLAIGAYLRRRVELVEGAVGAGEDVHRGLLAVLQIDLVAVHGSLLAGI